MGKKARKVNIVSVGASCPNCGADLEDNDGVQRILPKPGKVLDCVCGEEKIRLPMWVGRYAGE